MTDVQTGLSQLRGLARQRSRAPLGNSPRTGGTLRVTPRGSVRAAPLARAPARALPAPSDFWSWDQARDWYRLSSWRVQVGREIMQFLRVAPVLNSTVLPVALALLPSRMANGELPRNFDEVWSPAGGFGADFYAPSRSLRDLAQGNFQMVRVERTQTVTRTVQVPVLRQITTPTRQTVFMPTLQANPLRTAEAARRSAFADRTVAMANQRIADLGGWLQRTSDDARLLAQSLSSRYGFAVRDPNLYQLWGDWSTNKAFLGNMIAHQSAQLRQGDQAFRVNLRNLVRGNEYAEEVQKQWARDQARLVAAEQAYMDAIRQAQAEADARLAEAAAAQQAAVIAAAEAARLDTVQVPHVIWVDVPSTVTVQVPTTVVTTVTVPEFRISAGSLDEVATLTNARPRKNDKRDRHLKKRGRDRKMSKWYGAALSALHAIDPLFEAVEIYQVFLLSLYSNTKLPGWWYDKSSGHWRPGGVISAQAEFWDQRRKVHQANTPAGLMANFRKGDIQVDWEGFVEGLLANQLEDAAYAVVGRATARAAEELGLPHGFGMYGLGVGYDEVVGWSRGADGPRPNSQ